MRKSLPMLAASLSAHEDAMTAPNDPIRTTRPSRFLVGVVLAASLAACGKADDEPGGAALAPAASPGDPAPSAAGTAPAPSGKDVGRCKVDVTGDVTASAEPVRHAVTDTKVSFGTDYWMTDDELETALGVIVGLGDDKAGDKDTKVAEAMKQDPRLFVFLMNCGDDDVTMSVLPGKDSRYADIPRAPKKYIVTKEPRAGELSVMLSVGDGHFGVKAPGTLDVARFDSSRIEGTFAFDAEERFGKKRNVKVTGSFEFDCVGSQSCGRK